MMVFVVKLYTSTRVGVNQNLDARQCCKLAQRRGKTMWYLIREDLCGNPRYIKNATPNIELTSLCDEACLFDVDDIHTLLVTGKVRFDSTWNVVAYSTGQSQALTREFLCENSGSRYAATRGNPFMVMDDVVRTDDTIYTFFRTVGGGQNG